MRRIARYTIYLLVALKRPVVWIPVVIFLGAYLLNFWATIIYPDTLYGGPGDHTAGLIWLYQHAPDTPWWQFTSASGYPWGDSLWSPLFVMGQVGYLLFWLCAKVTGGAVGGYNLFTGIGFLLSFLAVYLFIHSRFKLKPLLSSLLAAVVVFTPMSLYLDGVGHSSYVFMPLYLVAVIWLSLLAFERRSLKYAAALGVVVGSTIFFDPYFVLFIPIVAVIMLVGLALGRYHVLAGFKWRDLLVRAVTVMVAGLIIVTPAVVYLKVQSGKVNAEASSSRTSMMHDAGIYSARVKDYLLPPLANPFVPDGIKEIKSASFHGSDKTFTLYLGWTLILGVAFTAGWWLRRRPRSEHMDRRVLGYILLVIAIVGFILSLPPVLVFLGYEFYMPTWLIVTITPAWRVFARWFFVIQPLLVLIVAIGLSEYLSRIKMDAKKTRRFHMFAVAAVLLLAVEYIPRNPLDASSFWTYDRKLPSTYQFVETLPDSIVLAEFPMREQPYYRGSYYFNGQYIHEKTLFNSYSPVSPQAFLRISLMDLANPQTLPVLRQLGVTHLLVWSNEYQSWTPDEHSRMSLLKTEVYKVPNSGKEELLRIYDISGVNKRRFMFQIDRNYRPDDKALHSIATPIANGTTIQVVDLCDVAEVCSGTEESDSGHIVSADIMNSTNESQHIQLMNKQTGKITEITVVKGESRVEMSLDVGAYEVRVNSELNDRILLKNFEVQ